MGEKSIQILKLAVGCYPFWSGRVCLLTRVKRERETVVCCVIPRGVRVIGPQGFGEGCCVFANTDGIVINLQFRLISHTASEHGCKELLFTQQTANVNS